MESIIYREVKYSTMSQRVILGGTFGPLHDGHRQMLKKAFEAGNPTIGLTSDTLARKTRDEPRYIPLAEEKREVILTHECEKFAEEYDREYKIFVLDHPTQKAVETENFDAIIISPEGKVDERVQEINEQRKENGYAPLETITAEMMFAEDGGRISSTRIIKGEIDEHGNVIEWF